MKRLMVALASLGLNTVFAGSAIVMPSSEPSLPFPDSLVHDVLSVVSIPQLHGGVFVGASGYYLQPSSNNNDLDFLRITFPTASHFFNIDPSYNWGGGINAGIIFPDTGNDIEARYFHLETDDKNSASLPISIFSTEIFFTSPIFNPGLYNQARSTALYNINQVDVVGGQYINVGGHLHVHPIAGVRWADINRKLNSAYAGVLTTVEQVLDNSLFINEKSDFEGVGPLAGVDVNYSFMGGLGIVGHFDSALLVGKVDTNTRILFSNFLDGIGNVTARSSNASTTRIIPALDEKLGLNYTLIFNNAINSSLSLEVGYQADQYFNAVDRTFNTNQLVPNFIEKIITSDFALNGGYVSLTLTV